MLDRHAPGKQSRQNIRPLDRARGNTRRKTHRPEEVINKLPAALVLLSSGATDNLTRLDRTALLVTHRRLLNVQPSLMPATLP